MLSSATENPAAAPGPASDAVGGTGGSSAAGVTLLIPAFNEGGALGATLDALAPYRGCFREIVVVDDGSTDQTAAVAQARGARVIRHGQNRGYGAALKTGAAEARTDYVFMFDADGQHPAGAIPDFIAQAAGCDAVFGQRVKGSDAALPRRPGKWLLAKIANQLAGARIPDINCGMRLVRRDLIQRYGPILPEGFSLSTTLTIATLKDRHRVRWVAIKTDRREGRSSSVRFFRDGLNTLLLILRVIMLFDPLKIFLPVSLVLGLLGACDLTYETIAHPPFHLSSTTVLCFMVSILVFLFGLVADQLAALRRQLR